MTKIFKIVKNKNREAINKMRNEIDKIDNNNPSLNIIDVNINNKNIHVIQDAVLLSGTKQRVAIPFLKTLPKHINTVCYSGTYNGYGAVATSYGAYKLGLTSKVFLSSIPTGSLQKSSIETIMNSKQIITLLALKAKIYICDDYRTARDSLYKILDSNNDHYLIEMGLNDPENVMTDLLSKLFQKAMKNTILDTALNNTMLNNTMLNNTISNPDKKIRIFMVAGSGGILTALNKAFKKYNVEFLVFLTGGGRYKKRVIEYIKQNKNIRIINDNNNYINTKEYYQTVKNYDDKIIPYVEKYGRNGDFIFNVAKD